MPIDPAFFSFSSCFMVAPMWIRLLFTFGKIIKRDEVYPRVVGILALLMAVWFDHFSLYCSRSFGLRSVFSAC